MKRVGKRNTNQVNPHIEKNAFKHMSTFKQLKKANRKSNLLIILNNYF